MSNPSHDQTAHPAFPRSVSILGSTGSIGRKALAVVARYPDRFTIRSLAAHSSVDELARQTREFGVKQVVLTDDARVAELRAQLPADVTVEAGPEALVASAVDPDTDVVVNGVVGRAGLEASVGAAEAGKLLALANKESLVLAGELVMAAAARGGGAVIPVDSEHSGLFQCLEGRPREQVRRLLITASGGPFRGRSRAELETVTPEEALNHPIWPMGPRITVDSATLFNKGLEVIETHRLFGVPLRDIQVWVHPQSVVHALVEMVDGSHLAQLSAPDMMLPVQYAMTYPERWDCDAPGCSLPDWGSLTFDRPDLETFPALALAYRAGEEGGTAPAILNAADEVAVGAFLKGDLPFLAIPELVEAVLDSVTIVPADSVAAVVAADRDAREHARSLLEARAT